ncbi:hypothetical protein M5K25_018942 [Dendrobium thyrsiflorum]|uniref:Uncharacterized protein n=1 Tax=Dendrobium thyrsiflorum TaxID=117978 RepID=A0ABD0UE37_DENTH
MACGRSWLFLGWGQRVAGSPGGFSKVQVLNLISLLTEHLGEKITPFAGQLVNFFRKVTCPEASICMLSFQIHLYICTLLGKNQLNVLGNNVLGKRQKLCQTLKLHVNELQGIYTKAIIALHLLVAGISPALSAFAVLYVKEAERSCFT